MNRLRLFLALLIACAALALAPAAAQAAPTGPAASAASASVAQDTLTIHEDPPALTSTDSLMIGVCAVAVVLGLGLVGYAVWPRREVRAVRVEARHSRR